ncbi:DUF3618 domain-containing protein [Alkalilimnicola ehrlichii]|nr:DUF3618 domain-containing protein [Alkalilimnicola ehrlichii]
MADRDNRQQVEEIEHEIAETRAQLGHTVDVLQHKVSPRHIRARTLGRLQRRGGMYDRVARSVRQNPLMYGLLASAVAWRLFAGRREARLSSRDMSRLRDELAAAYASERWHGEGEPTMTGRQMQRMHHGAARLRGDLQGRAQQLRHRWQEQAPQTRMSGLSGLLGVVLGAMTQSMMIREPEARAGSPSARESYRDRAEESVAESIAVDETGFSVGAPTEAPPSPGLEENKRPIDR